MPLLDKPDEKTVYRISRICVGVIIGVALLLGLLGLISLFWHPEATDNNTAGGIAWIFILVLGGPLTLSLFWAPLLGIAYSVTLLFIASTRKRKWYALFATIVSAGAEAALVGFMLWSDSF